ncbi:MAG: zinc ribbon domain-containing protein [Clostridia bacterium]|nr:zinc ribbon domain-containing protein [Clostridia bacterium]
MYCSNCGKQIPDNTKFCNHCGAQQPSETPTKPVTETKADLNTVKTSGSNNEKQPKKKTNIVVILAVVLCAFLIGRLIAYFIIKPVPPPEPVPDSNQYITVDNGDYEAVFEGTYIVHFQSMFNMDTASFALKQADGIISCADYGYKDDIVKQLVETVYIPVSGYDDAQKAELENSMRAEYADIEALSCASVTYKMSVNYLTVTCTYSDLDKEENYTELYNAGMLNTKTFISMSETEKNRLNEGFAKKQED